MSLIARASAMEPDAWRRLCEIYGALVYRWTRGAGVKDQDAADVGQEVFRTVAARIGSFDHQRDEATFRGWLWTITRNKIGDYYRRQASVLDAAGGSTAYGKLQEAPELVQEDSSESATFDETTSVLHRVLQVIRPEFEDHTWQAFWRLTVDGRSAAQIADELNMTAPAVRQAKYRILRRLRLELGQEIG